MTIWYLLQENSLAILAILAALYAISAKRMPSIQTWQAFLDSFESKGGQLLLLWVTDFIVLGIIVHYWKIFDAQLQTTIVGLLSGINGAFLGAIGARNTGNGGGGGGGTPKLTVGFQPGTAPVAAASSASTLEKTK